MRRAAIILLIASPAAAQWSSNWPSWEHPRSGKAQATECYSSLVERCQAQVMNAPTAPVWYRTQKGNLEVQKSKILEMINGGFWIVPMDDYTPYCAEADYPFLTVTGILINANLPTNYLDYTPWRCLSGLGPFTNDLSVGHPYGYSNATTAAGGTNGLPSGRSAWYTTDYGWSGITGIVSHLKVTWNVGVFEHLFGQDNYYGGDCTYDDDQTTWAGAKAFAEAAAGTGVSTFGPWAYSEGATYYLGDYKASFQVESEVMVCSLPDTNNFRSLEVYVHATNSPSGNDENPFNGNGVVVEGWQKWWDTSGGGYGSSVTSSIVGVWPISQVPVWCDAPTADETNAISKARGFYISGHAEFVRYDFLFD